MSEHLVYVDSFDVAHDEQAIFNRLYDGEVLPELRKVPGVLRVARYQTESRRDPRYLTVYEISGANIIGTGAWTAATEKAPWSDRLLALVMNRHERAYARVGGNVKLTYRTKYLLFVSIDIEARKEELLNQLYDSEHIPLLLRLPGVANVVRYKTAQGNPRYLAIYELEHPDIPASKEWTVASDSGRRKVEVKPYTFNRSFVVYEPIGGS